MCYTRFGGAVGLRAATRLFGRAVCSCPHRCQLCHCRVLACDVQNWTCRRPTLMRPPYGDTSPAVRSVLHNMGYWSLIWALDTQDWDYAATQPSWVTANFSTNLASVFPGGIFSLEHDIYQGGGQCQWWALSSTFSRMLTFPLPPLALLICVRVGVSCFAATVNLVPAIISMIKAQGYVFTSLEVRCRESCQ